MVKNLTKIDSLSGATTMFATGTYDCGSVIADDYSGHGYHRYTGYTLDLSGTPLGSTISLTLTSYDVPNRFTVYNSSHYVVAYTDWMGYANYSGPWGLSLNTSEHQTITFKRNLSTDYTLEVETSVNTMSDSWDASVSCSYTPNISVTQFTDATTTDSMLTIFNSLTNVNFPELSTELGLSDSLTESDIDFVQLFKSKDMSEPDSGWAIMVNFKSNSNSNTINYGFGVCYDGANYFKPIVVKSVTNVKQQIFDLTDGTITTINNYNTSNFSFSSTVGGYMRTQAQGCGQAVADCINDAYTNHGWVSVWAWVQSAVLPETVGAIALGCTIKNCGHSRQ